MSSTNPFEAVPAVGGGDDLRSGIAAWIDSEPLSTLIREIRR